ncbi:unnamed protein product [Ilex paraguariensis]|uniref:Uncharacterized protein n=1 Tax=Ilex paraguariensis TaxID=185542 RepID=A0ABC8SLY6_9AQUA
MKILPIKIKRLGGSVATLANWFSSWVIMMTAPLLFTTHVVVMAALGFLQLSPPSSAGFQLDFAGSSAFLLVAFPFQLVCAGFLFGHALMVSAATGFLSGSLLFLYALALLVSAAPSAGFNVLQLDFHLIFSQFLCGLSMPTVASHLSCC